MRRILIPISILIVTILLGTLGYPLVSLSPVSFLDSFFMTIITISTVGFGETVPLAGNPPAIFLTTLIIILGMANLGFVLSSITAMIVGEQINHFFWTQRVKKKINQLKNHFIICGAGINGHYIIQELIKTQRAFVVIEQDKEVVEKLKAEFDNILILLGDASEEDVLIEAGIEHAQAVACTLPLDKDNLFLTLTIKHTNPNCTIISKLITLKNHRKFHRAGATSLVVPNHIGALRFVSELVRPNVVSFLDTMLRDKTHHRIEEIVIPENSWIAGKTLKEINLSKKIGIQIIGIRDHQTGDFNYAPQASTKVHINDTLFSILNPKQTEQLNAFIK